MESLLLNGKAWCFPSLYEVQAKHLCLTLPKTLLEDKNLCLEKETSQRQGCQVEEVMEATTVVVLYGNWREDSCL